MKRRITFLSAIMLAAACCSSAQAATFLNYSDKPVYVARAEYEPYSSQPDVTPARYRFSGWKRVDPGGVFNTSSGWMYVQDSNGRPLRYNLKTMTGVIKNGKFPSAYLPKRYSQQDLKNLKSRGYKVANYMYFGNGTYNFPGTAYRMQQKSFSFSHESRGLQFIQPQTYNVPGTVTGYSVKCSDDKWASIKWNRLSNGRGVFHSGHIKGRQVRLGGPREPAKYKGRVTVSYLRRQ